MVDYPDIDVAEANWIDEDTFRPRYNIAPRSNAPVIRRQSDEDSNLVIHTMKWGVVPHWCKYEDLTLNTINARAENLVETGGMWASMKSKKRCVVVCDGYFEWLKKGKDRLPHFMRRKDGKLMILAGLYDSVLLEGATARMWTFTIVTTTAAPSFSWLHDRQPVILSTTTDFEAWLDTSKGWHAGLIDILKSRDGKDLECYPVPKEVGKVGTNSAAFIKPVSQRKDGIEAMFAKQAAKGKHVAPASPDRQSLSSPVTLTPPDSDPIAQSSAGAGLSAVKDSPAAKRAIEIDASPTKKRRLDPSHEVKVKRPMEVETQSLTAKKRVKRSASSGGQGCLESGMDKRTQGPSDDKPCMREGTPSDSMAQSKSRTKGNVKASASSPSKRQSSKHDASNTKITTFFRPHM